MRKYIAQSIAGSVRHRLNWLDTANLAGLVLLSSVLRAPLLEASSEESWVIKTSQSPSRFIGGVSLPQRMTRRCWASAASSDGKGGADSCLHGVPIALAEVADHREFRAMGRQDVRSEAGLGSRSWLYHSLANCQSPSPSTISFEESFNEARAIRQCVD